MGMIMPNLGMRCGSLLVDFMRELYENTVMPKASEFPKFRTCTKRGAEGQTWVSYWYDNRGTGRPDIPLGTDREQALASWERIRDGIAEGRKPLPMKPRKFKAKAQPIDRPPAAKAPGKRRNFSHAEWAAAPSWAKPLYLLVETRSRRDGRVAFLSPAEYLAVVKRADGRCELSGLPFDLERSAGRRAPFAPSLDRIDCAKGYIAGNVRLVTIIMNCALGDFGETVLEVAAKAFLAARSGSGTPACKDDLETRLQVEAAKSI